jgi:hypothetical protein
MEQERGLAEFGMSVADFFAHQSAVIERTKRRLSPAEAQRMQTRLDNADYPTKLQNKGTYLSLETLYQRIHECAQRTGLSIGYRPILASVIGIDLNGCTVSIDDAHAILIDETFFHFAIILAKIVASGTAPETPDEPWFPQDVAVMRRRVNGRQNIIANFNDLLTSHVLTGSVTAAKHVPFSADPVHVAFMSAVNEGICKFLMGHEYGHLYFRHHDNPIIFNSRTDKGLRTVGGAHDRPAFLDLQNLEFQADHMAFHFCLNSDPSTLLTQSNLIGALSFFYATDLLSAALWRWTGKESPFTVSPLRNSVFEVSTHPCGALRAGLWGTHMENSKAPQEFVDEINKIDQCLITFFEVLWEHFLDDVGREFMDAHPPHPRWSAAIREYLSSNIVDGTHLERSKQIAILLGEGRGS